MPCCVRVEQLVSKLADAERQSQRLTTEVENAHKARHAEISQLGRELALLRGRLGVAAAAGASAVGGSAEEEIDLLTCNGVEDALAPAEKAVELQFSLERERFEKDQLRSDLEQLQANLKRTEAALAAERLEATEAQREALQAKVRVHAQRESHEMAIQELQKALRPLKDTESELEKGKRAPAP